MRAAAAVPLKLLLQLSSRNLWRHRRRNGILVVAIALAVTGVMLMNALMRGMAAEMREAVIDNLTGHIKVIHPGYMADPGIGRSFEPKAGWEQALADVPVAGWAERVRVPAVIMSERETRGVQLVGVDPAREAISFLGSLSVNGEGLGGADDRRILIGQTLAEQLETSVGRRLVIMTQGADGLNREAGYRIAGTYDADSNALEKVFVFTGTETVARLLESAAVTEVSLRLEDGGDIPEALAELSAVFDDLDVKAWQDLEPQVASMVLVADFGLYIMYVVIMGALVFGLVNALVTAVMERVRELGMLRALGMRPRSVVAQVVVESSIVMVAGVVAGLGLSIVCYLPFADGIDLSAFSETMQMMGVRNVFTPRLLVSDMVIVFALSLVLGVLASLYPARRAVKVTPLDAMRR